jgi:hypothetical protein
MTAISFATSSELVTYVNDNTIVKADIVDITVVDGRWYIFHY